MDWVNSLSAFGVEWKKLCDRRRYKIALFVLKTVGICSKMRLSETKQIHIYTKEIKMLITEKNRYLIIPVSKNADEKRIFFYGDDVLLRDVVACVDFDNPDFKAYYDMKTFMGKDIYVVCDDAEFETSGHIVKNEANEIRPAYHFAANYGWLNDPNGLIFYENKYHIFYQHNPVGAVRGSEHWGHAVSDDLLCWKECEIALFPDDMGTMFSGSAIEDKENVLGMKENEHNPLVLFYTASGGERSVAAKGKPFVQCMAVSTDGGNTFEKYKNNPIIGEIGQRSRDPKVVYDEKHKVFIMVLFTDVDYSGNYTVFKSKNLTEWTRICDFAIPGERECPDIYAFDDNGVTRWVFFGGNGYYITAELDIEKGLMNVSTPKKIAYASYAAQSFSGLNKCIRIAWARMSLRPMTEWGKNPQMPTKTYSQFMSIPAEITLAGDRLKVKPLYDFAVEKSYSNITAKDTEIQLCKQPVGIYIKSNIGNFNIKLFGNKIEIRKNTVRFYNLLGDIYEMPYEGEMKIFADNIGYDIFVSDKFCATYQAASDYNDNILLFEGDVELEKLEIGHLIFPANNVDRIGLAL